MDASNNNSISPELEKICRVIRKTREGEIADVSMTASEISQLLFKKGIFKRPPTKGIKKIVKALNQAEFPSRKVNKKVLYDFKYIKESTN